MLTAVRVSQEVGVSVPTINSWYRWWNNPDTEKPADCPGLPAYEQEGKGIRYWREEDMKQIRDFHEWMPRGRAGVMGSINAAKWGQRGVRALENKKKRLEQSD